ncbi:GNAT family N-acetyltransferase [Enterococcus villorum]|uniref:GNAT family N-acetyltransferase n=1 Tax=Enterococcus villorum TaxID=112904 RepID=A0A1V8YCB6_9ENTE|nr:GNAT family N-acetyltransferase [Enterococcus villorum]OQO70254.1 GNAT family N-acetyltransferase [Enterococcus villorum]OQO76983.1 GNAT family N-acetyltransferase [Enterococcus villorum]
MENKDNKAKVSSKIPTIMPLDKANLPWSLLLDADPDKEKVQQYIDSGSGFVWQRDNAILGVIIFVVRKTEFEIMNVAVTSKEQNKGIGYNLLIYTLQELQKIKTTQQKIIVRTGSITSNALHLYRKVGFKETIIERDYFIKNYPEPIYENGKLLRDQVTLEIRV